MGIPMRTLQLGWPGLDHELVLFPHPDLILTLIDAPGGCAGSPAPAGAR